MRRPPLLTRLPSAAVTAASFAGASLELIFLLSEQHVEAGKRTVASAHVALQLDLHVIGQVGGVDLLFESPQPIPHHHNLVKEGLNRPRLFLKPGRSTSAPPRHLSAGTTGVIPVSSRMMRRSNCSRSAAVSVTAMGADVLSRSLTMGNGAWLDVVRGFEEADAE